MDDATRERKLDLIKNQIKILMASFDTIQIFATKYDPTTGATSHFSSGDGNYFARYGQVCEWLVREDQANVE
jgi:hypothetical protein